MALGLRANADYKALNFWVNSGYIALSFKTSADYMALRFWV